jgi:hypothetical protein
VKSSSSERTVGSWAAVEEEAAAGGETAAFSFVGRRNVAVGVLGASAERWVDRVEVARVEGRIGGSGG